MKIEIWSDIMCPFCYIGKRNFETALSRFPHKEEIEVEWKSFQLDPSIPEVPKYQHDMYQFVADRKGLSYEQSKRMHQDVIRMAKNVGLEYNFDTALVTNSLKGHRLIQYAKAKGLAGLAEERLFLAYFTRGKNLNDLSTLIELGQDIGLSEQEVTEALTNPIYQDRVIQEAAEAQQLGARGVPFFVVDRKSAIAGAQQPDVILKVIENSYSAWKQTENHQLSIQEGASCSPSGNSNC
jgi:protein disulfide-isomerase